MTAVILPFPAARRTEPDRTANIANPFFPVVYCAQFWAALLGKRLAEYGRVGSGEVIEFPEPPEAA